MEEQDGVTFNVFHHAATGSKLRYVNDSGICETTPGVHQKSGYATLGENLNMWFWFFEARHNPETAPLVINLAGGPGGNIEESIFGHDGPCRILKHDTEPSLNPYSFNEHANMLYIDQPFATGFSYGFNPINSTEMSSQYLWMFLQAFIKEFSSFQGREFGIYTASYGGRFGPGLGYEILRRNDAIRAGRESGLTLDLKAIGLQNACMDLAIDAEAKVAYAYYNKYEPLVNRTSFHRLQVVFQGSVRPLIEDCQEEGSVRACKKALETYAARTENPITRLAELYGTSITNLGPYGSETVSAEEYLWRTDVLRAIGAHSELQDEGGREKFDATGDGARSAIPHLAALLEAGVEIAILTGDADFLCNCFGTHAVALNIPWSGKKGFVYANWTSYDLDGSPMGRFKTFENLALVEVLGGAHGFGFQFPDLLLQLFKQTMTRNFTST